MSAATSPATLREGFVARLFSGSGGGPSFAAAATLSLPPSARILFACVHGLGGQPEDLSALRECLLAGGPGVAVHLCRANARHLLATYDGVAAGARRLAAELSAVVAANPQLTHVSFVGNSLGTRPTCRRARARARPS